MRHRATFLPLLAVLAASTSGLATPKEVFTDPESGHEVWRMTDAPERDIMQYYDIPTISPNGRYLIFRSNRAPYLFIMNSDGSDEKAIGDYSFWITEHDIDFSANNLQGWWSHDSRKYYAYKSLYVIDVERLQAGAAIADCLSQISSEHADSFYYPQLSPDGRSLYGVSIPADSDAGLLKLIDVDGSNYREFEPPLYVANGGSHALDVTHGWLGNDQAWYMNDDNVEYLNANLVFDVQTGLGASDYPRLEVEDPSGSDVWFGNLGHLTTSPSAYFVGGGAGFVAGHGRAFKYANSDYTTQDATLRGLTTVGDVIANHHLFSPDARWIATADILSEGPDRGMILAFPIRQSATEPVKIARYMAAADVPTQEISTDPRFSPDGTKNIFYGDVREPGNDDIYVAVFRAPDAPTELAAAYSTNGTVVTWKPAALHREIRAYAVSASETEEGPFEAIATVEAVPTYLDVPSKLDASSTNIPVDDTSAFPDAGALEISGLSSELPSEVVAYAGKTATSFTGCTRGAAGTAAAEHWNDSFVWIDTSTTGVTDTATAPRWYRVRSIEWSGLESPETAPVRSQPAGTPPDGGPPPSDAGDGGSGAGGTGGVEGADTVRPRVEESGCGCRVTRGAAPRPLDGALLALGFVLWTRRRATRARSASEGRPAPSLWPETLGS